MLFLMILMILMVFDYLLMVLMSFDYLLKGGWWCLLGPPPEGGLDGLHWPLFKVLNQPYSGIR